MPRFQPNPYNGFKDDRERRLALNARARWNALALFAIAILGKPFKLLEWMLGVQSIFS